MPFAKTLTHDSKALPGVKFTVHRMGLGRRTDLDMQTLPQRSRMRELEADYPPLSNEERELREQLDIAERKAATVPPKELEQVIAADVLPLRRDLEAQATPETKRKRDVIDEEYRIQDARIRCAWILAGLVSIEDLREGVDEQDLVGGMTAAELLDVGPPQLAQEIYQALLDDGRLRGAATKNSPSPTISGALVGGTQSKASNINAPNAADQQAAGI